MMLSRAPRPLSFRLRLRARLIRLAMLFATLALASGTLAACGQVSTAEVLPLTGPLLTVEMRGGMCPEGACDNSVILERDGRVHAAAKEPNALGQVTPQNMSTLTAAIAATDFAALKAKPFTGECPIAFDGQELIFEFSTMNGTQRLASCEVDIDWGHPLFVAVATALGEWIPLPLV